MQLEAGEGTQTVTRGRYQCPLRELGGGLYSVAPRILVSASAMYDLDSGNIAPTPIVTLMVSPSFKL